MGNKTPYRAASKVQLVRQLHQCELAVEYAKGVLNRGFWGRLKWALFKR